MVVPIFWSGDVDETGIVEFDKWLLSSPTWIQLVGEYTDSNGTHIGAGSVLATQQLGSPPPTIDDATLQSLVSANVKSGAWPAPDTSGNTLYVFYLHPFTSIPGGCTSFGGYHSTGNGFRYAVVLRCGSLPKSLDEATVVSTHEIGEAATDADANDTGWTFAPFNIPNEGENGDLCAWETTRPDGVHMIQRMFSNSADLAGGDPCVPVPSGEGTYANVLIDPTAVDVSVANGGTTFVIPFANGPVSGPLSLTVRAYGLDIQGPVNLIVGQQQSWNIHVKSGSGLTPGYYVPLNVTVTYQSGAQTVQTTAYAAVRINP